MEYRKLGKTDLQVSVICLGTMTWGSQNIEEEGHEQLDYALDHGINFIDTAEVYAVPLSPDYYGRTETIIGNWLKNRKRRERVVLATKVAGANVMPWIREGHHKLDRPNITRALEDSLTRLRTDYIDLYQIHWPDRANNRFGQREYIHRPESDKTPIAETLEVLDGFVRQGKIRHIGVSNETPWGMMNFFKIAETRGWSRIVSIQNSYSLLDRSFEVGLSEIALRESCGLLAYSPIAGGVLSGKYVGGVIPKGSRYEFWGREWFSRFTKPNGNRAAEAYTALAKEHQLDPSQMAIAYVLKKGFVTSAIIGATSIPQLTTNVAASEVKLSQEVLEGIEAIHHQYPNPCP